MLFKRYDYYTLRDLYYIWANQNLNPVTDVVARDMRTTEISFNSMYQAVCGTDPYNYWDREIFVKKVGNDYVTKDFVIELFNNIVFRFADSFGLKTEAENTDAEKILAANKVFNNLLNIISFTYEKYATILNIYRTKQTELLNKVQTLSVSRFNDTPQDGGLFADDDHTTNVTEYSQENDIEPLMNRIKQIQESFQNVMLKWTDEFKLLFWEE